MFKTIPAIAALMAACVLVVPTVSQAAETRTVLVPYADLNLASEAGASILERRIVGAAQMVCQIEDSRELGLAQATMVCREDAVAGAQPAFRSALAAARNPSVTVGGAAIAVTAR